MASVEEHFVLLAYCLMPDHLHLLIEGTPASSDMCSFVSRAKQRAAMSCKRMSDTPLWQAGYYDRVLRGSDDVKAFVLYIMANPVRAGLVASPAEYPHCGSDVWTMDELLDGV